MYFGWIKMNWTERLAKVWNLGNAKLQTRNCGLRFAVYLMLKISNIGGCLVPRRLSRWKCARKGRREGDNGWDSASPAVCSLPMVPCGSSPVTLVSRSPLRWEKRSAWGGGCIGGVNWTDGLKGGGEGGAKWFRILFSPDVHRRHTLLCSLVNSKSLIFIMKTYNRGQKAWGHFPFFACFYKGFAANGHCTLIKNKYKFQSRDL